MNFFDKEYFKISEFEISRYLSLLMSEVNFLVPENSLCDISSLRYLELKCKAK